jgi:hypothetical protein
MAKAKTITAAIGATQKKVQKRSFRRTGRPCAIDIEWKDESRSDALRTP